MSRMLETGKRSSFVLGIYIVLLTCTCTSRIELARFDDSPVLYTLAILFTYSGGPDAKRQVSLYEALTVRYRGNINV